MSGLLQTLRILFFFLGSAVLFHPLNILAQNAFGQDVQIAFGGMASWNYDDDDRRCCEFYLLSSALSIRTSKSTRVGYRNYLIHEKPLRTAATTFLIHGVFGQWDYIVREKASLWLESGLYVGDYCPCGRLEGALVRRNTSFWQIGGGSRFRLFSGFQLELSGRHGFYLPKIPGVRIGDMGIFVQLGLIYQMRLR